MTTPTPSIPPTPRPAPPAVTRPTPPRTAPPAPAAAALPTSPTDLLSSTDRLLGSAQVTSSTTGVWPRAAALLLRLALEEGLRQYWRRVRPELARCPTHAQALCLESYAGADLARRWSAVWSGLSKACHYHSYELSPTAGELRAWRDEVATLLGELPRKESQQ